MPATLEHPIAACKKARDTRSIIWLRDLRAVKESTITLYLPVPNLYIPLGLIPSTAEWFTCLILKDAFFHLWVAPVSQSLFAFEWENPYTGNKEQLT